jgi:hypothetical protein
VPSPLIVRSDEPNASGAQFSLLLDVCNQSSASQSLTGVVLKYWYSRDSTTGLAQTAAVDHTDLGSPTLAMSQLDPAVAEQNMVMEATLSGSLAAGACGVLQLRIYAENYAGDYDVTNDWSYVEGTDAVNDHITLHQDDNLIWGIPPEDPEPTP